MYNEIQSKLIGTSKSLLLGLGIFENFRLKSLVELKEYLHLFTIGAIKYFVRIVQHLQ